VNPTPPRGDPQVLAFEKDRVVVVSRLDEAARPAWSGAVEDGVLWIPGESSLVAIELASGEELGRIRTPPGRLTAVRDTVVVARDDEVAAFACRPAAPPPRALPEDPRELVERLSSRDWRERRAAFDCLKGLGEKAEPALRLALDAPSAEARVAASEIMPTLELRDLWAKAASDRSLGVASEELVAADPQAQLQALKRAHKGDKDPGKASPSLNAVLRRVFSREQDVPVRVEVLGWLVARDDEARAAVIAALLDREEPGRASAAEVLANAGATDPGSPAHAAFVDVMSSERDEVRSALYLALLRHGGTLEKQAVELRVTPWKDKDGKDHPVDPVADAALKTRANEQRIRPNQPGRTDGALERQDDRRALLDKIKLGE
jgi:hypothetical protein